MYRIRSSNFLISLQISDRQFKYKWIEILYSLVPCNLQYNNYKAQHAWGVWGDYVCLEKKSFFKHIPPFFQIKQNPIEMEHNSYWNRIWSRMS